MRDWTTLADLVTWIADDAVVFAEDSPFTAHVTAGDPSLVVVTGENASGKSLLCRVAAAKAHLEGMVPVAVSIRERTGSGTAEMARFRQTMMFGDENDQSTGAISARVVGTAFNNLDRQQGSLLVLDEPELGLSDGYARALGEHVGTQSRTIPESCAGVLVVTHSRSLAAGICDGYPTTPTWVHVTATDETATSGPVPATLADWVASTEHRTVADLLSLPETGLARFRAVRALLQQN